MYARLYAVSALAAAGMIFCASPASATTYDFGSVQGDATPQTLNGATFSSPSDPGAFTFGPNAGLYSNLGAYVLSSAGTNETLTITFSQAQTGLSFDFATADFLGLDGGDFVQVAASNGSQYTSTATVPGTDLYPEGTFSISGVPSFTSVSITASDNLGEQSLNIADLTSTPAGSTVPLPSTAWLMLPALGLLAMRRRARAS